MMREGSVPSREPLPRRNAVVVGKGNDVALSCPPPHIARRRRTMRSCDRHIPHPGERSEEHTSELQSRQYLVCRLLLEKKEIVDARGACGVHDLLLGRLPPCQAQGC